MKEAWAIMEVCCPVYTSPRPLTPVQVVREQCWLNELLKGCRWTPDDLTAVPDSDASDNVATDDELQAVLSGMEICPPTRHKSLSHLSDIAPAGTLTPRKIPVNVYIPTSQPVGPDALFDAPAKPQPCVVLSSPERPPITGLVEISITHDVTRPRGVSVQVRGAMGADVRVEVLEEKVRRGGAFSLPGCVWASAHTAE